MAANDDHQLLQRAHDGIPAYLENERAEGRIDRTYYNEASSNVLPNLRTWLLAEELDRISPGLRHALREAIQSGRWPALTNAFVRQVAFGTGGIREKMGATRDEILKLKCEGIHAPILKGPNTINDVVYLLTSAGAARFGRSRTPPLTGVVIGYDSRICGDQFARLVATLFVAYDYTVYLFDEACTYPGVTFAVPALGADMGIFISASHNDFRYNGFKLSCQNGSQFDPAERKELYEKFIRPATFADIRTRPLSDAVPEKLWFLGGLPGSGDRVIQTGRHAGLPLADPLPDAADRYAGRHDRIIDLHSMHAAHVRSFLMRPDIIRNAARPLVIGFSAYNGAGRKAVPRLLAEAGIQHVHRITKLDPLDGMFPAFCSDPGREQQPDPGDWRAVDIAVTAFQQEYPDRWDNVDLIIGTDPDADRCGVIVKVPPHQQSAYPHPGTGQPRDYTLLSADDAWCLILWYRLATEIERFGRVREKATKFIALSHTTTDALARIARKHGLGVLRTWVGFAQLAAATRAVWDLRAGRDTPGITDNGRLPPYVEGRLTQTDAVCNRTLHSWEAMDDPHRSVNIAAMEQSNGFSILGGPPPDKRSLGAGGHVRDKDGVLAALLVAELAAYAKEMNTNLIDLLDEKIFLDPDVGLYVTHYEPDPLDGEYEGLAGSTKKRDILDRAEELLHRAGREEIAIGGLPVTGTITYGTGKYDAANWPGFPDEGYRYFLDQQRRSHLTIRPSGTSNALRFHVQLFGGHPSRHDLLERKTRLRAQAARVVHDLRRRIGATDE